MKHIKLNFKYLSLLLIIQLFLLSACNNNKVINEFTYDQFKEALYYNSSTGDFSDLGNLEMCINRWGLPKYVKSIGTMDINGNNSKLNAIIFEWSNINIDGKNVEITFEPIPNSGKSIEDVFTNSINENKARYLKVKEYRLVPISSSN
ncbi:hypothetical protein [Aequorivita viscosa]|uniref:Lipoprotein n=1 Tax=Aequorivita viscosa TaxID=797419 RepID=A0A1M6MM22_9FLAO|nr:hypothetical protein [Aequorivita viscosa]SDX50538.1 hypothetical protein SAMN05216556_1384 [Aequorivita viscosa]SHJ84528.1 hypothetical protein SAMN04487908_12818 [Aequorivita viscosa]